MERNTKQRTIILDYLKSVKTHPTAEIVFNDIKKKLPNISLATVYRILNNLSGEGNALKLEYDVAHFDGDTSEHAHFICSKCNKIYDVFDIKINVKNKVGEIKNKKLYLYGICKKCLP